ncbi:cell division initiation protein [Streptomyces sp. BI20]|uniref:cell division initiation protein n=1 Tax=Streptomyces sp. BI20 TaxID=3403460 RepID=UPI003C727730
MDMRKAPGHPTPGPSGAGPDDSPVRRPLDAAVALVTHARAVPVSASCVVNRAELLGLLAELRAALPGALDRAADLLAGRDHLVAEARREADRMLSGARTRREHLVSETEVARGAHAEAERALAEARAEAAVIRAEAEDWVDAKLANFEAVLAKTHGSVVRGRARLATGAVDPLDPADPAPPEPTGDPAEARRRADAYADARLASLEAVLADTLDAVGRGRAKLQGHTAGDGLGAQLAARDAAEAAAGGRAREAGSDAEFLAGLAAPDPEPLATTGYAPAATGGAHEAPYEAPYDPAYGRAPEYEVYAPSLGPAYPDPYGPYETWGGLPGQNVVPAGTPGAAPSAPGSGYPDPYAGTLDETSLFDTSMIDLSRFPHPPDHR